MYTRYYREMLDETVRRERRAFEAHYASEPASPARAGYVPSSKGGSDPRTPTGKSGK